MPPTLAATANAAIDFLISSMIDSPFAPRDHTNIRAALTIAADLLLQQVLHRLAVARDRAEVIVVGLALDALVDRAGEGRVGQNMRAAGLLPERDFLAPVVLVALAWGDPDLEPDILGFAAGLADQAAQPLEGLEHLVARRPAVGHEAVAVLRDALERRLGMAAEPHRHLARLGSRVD